MVEFVLSCKIADHEMRLLQDNRYTPALKEAKNVDLCVPKSIPRFILLFIYSDFI
jgi:hypothetical protein